PRCLGVDVVLAVAAGVAVAVNVVALHEDVTGKERFLIARRPEKTVPRTGEGAALDDDVLAAFHEEGGRIRRVSPPRSVSVGEGIERVGIAKIETFDLNVAGFEAVGMLGVASDGHQPAVLSAGVGVTGLSTGRCVLTVDHGELPPRACNP